MWAADVAAVNEGDGVPVDTVAGVGVDSGVIMVDGGGDGLE
jgi:hypothetical protein